MLIALHKKARTTPAIRAEMAASNESVGALAADSARLRLPPPSGSSVYPRTI